MNSSLFTLRSSLNHRSVLSVDGGSKGDNPVSYTHLMRTLAFAYKKIEASIMRTSRTSTAEVVALLDANDLQLQASAAIADPIPVSYTHLEEAIKIWEGLQYKYNKFHNVTYRKDALEYAVQMCIRDSSYRSVPVRCRVPWPTAVPPRFFLLR